MGHSVKTFPKDKGDLSVVQKEDGEGTTRGRENEEVHSEDKENQDVLEGYINHKEGELVSSVKDT